jgi:putative transposase
MPSRLAGFALPAAMAGAVIARAEPRSRSASTPARWQLSGPACATSGALPSWDRAVAEDCLGKWAVLMLINVSTRKFRRAVRLPEGDVPAPTGAGVSKSAASRHFVALSAAQIDGIHISEHLVLVAALGLDSEGFKHPLGLMEGATEHSALVQALIDAWIERDLNPAVSRLFIIDGSEGAR